MPIEPMLAVVEAWTLKASVVLAALGAEVLKVTLAGAKPAADTCNGTIANSKAAIPRRATTGVTYLSNFIYW
jgi:hypothetical protein